MAKQDVSEFVNNPPFSSNEIRLCWYEWIVALVIIAILFYLVPAGWERMETFAQDGNYRISYELSNNYWLYSRYCRSVCSQDKILIIGDSVVWGQYVDKEHTLSHYLNELAGEERFANMGVDGLHPVAMAGLLNYYGKAVSEKNVILHCNLLWMSSKKHDLQGEKEFRFNHPRLVPQLIPNLACYKPSFAEVIAVMIERNIPFFSWIEHLKMNYFENMDIPNWMMQNPYKNPLNAVSFEIPVPENRPKSRPITWAERSMVKQNFPWVKSEESFQWEYFNKAIEILNSRNNKVFVLVGPFNPFILTEESFNRYNLMKSEMERWLKENRISYYSVPDLPSNHYADASHPLKKGYAIIAEGLFEKESFQKWIKSLKGKK